MPSTPKNQQASSPIAVSRPCRRHLLPVGEEDFTDSLQSFVSEGEVPPERKQEWSPSLGQENPEATQIKEEQGELWTSQEEEQLPGPFDTKDSAGSHPCVKSECGQREPPHVDILTEGPTLGQSRTSQLRAFQMFLKELVAPAAAVKIFAAVEKLVAEYQDENDHLRRILLLTPEKKLSKIDSLSLSEEEVPSEQHCEEWSPILGEADPDPTQIKEEKEELRTNQEVEQDRGAEPDIIKFIIPPSCVKSESDPEDPLITASQAQTVENRGREFKSGDLKTFYMISHLNCLDFPCELPDNQTNASSHSSALRRDPMGLDTCQPCNHRQNLNRHKLTHTGEKQFCCADCGKSFNHRHTLMRHKQTHTGEKRFTCGDCGKCFSQKGTLTQYELTDTEEKLFSCGDCGKSFSKRRNLKQHELTHTGEKPFRCADCGKSFSQRGTLTKHKLTHTGEKTFNCGDCSKSFMYRHHLKQHELTHTGEKPFRCADCGKSFMYRQHLKQHKLTHTGEKSKNCFAVNGRNRLELI